MEGGLGEFSFSDSPPQQSRDCERCMRPRSVCLCAWLPAEPLKLSGRMFVLQHPFEEKRRLATVPIATAALENFEVLRGRTFGPGKCGALTQLVEDAKKGLCNLYILFPGPGAVPLHEVLESFGTGTDVGLSEQPGMKEYGLIVLDGTWKEAKEIFKASSSWWLPPDGPGLRVEVSQNSMDRRNGALRMEPWEGCMTTVEAIAGALELLDPLGTSISTALIEPLHRMVEIQGEHSDSLRARREGQAPIVVNTKRRLGTRSLPQSSK